MNVRLTETCEEAVRGLSPSELKLFLRSVALLGEAAERSTANVADSGWPSQLKVRELAHTNGIFEMRWKLSGGNGRATWQWAITQDGHRDGILLRAIGGTNS